MSGIYIHVPFCQRNCHYCDFYKSVNLTNISPFLQALKKEIQLRREYLLNTEIKTVYFGGGTPSLLSEYQINSVFETIQQYYSIAKDAEITLETNPDDLNNNYLKSLLNTPINRLSVGIQSFHDQELKLMNRRHDSKQAIEAVKIAQDIGFENITADLIYGIPNSTLNSWQYSVEQMFALQVKHISAYHLTYEPKTVFTKWLQKNKISEIDEDLSFQQFNLLREYTNEHGYEHYEVSNFALTGYRSKHNSAYWTQNRYLGLGPSAHSYNITHRHWNVAHVGKYIEQLNDNVLPLDGEKLSEADMYNDFIITRLRTSDGFLVEDFKHLFSIKFLKHFQLKSTKLLKNKLLNFEGNAYSISSANFFISDGIIEELIYIQ